MFVRAIVFDAAGTLIYPEPDVIELYHNIGRQFGAPLDYNEIRIRFQAGFRTHFIDRTRAAVQTNSAIERSTWEQVVREVFPDVNDFDGLFKSLWNHFADGRNWRCFDDVAACLQSLKVQPIELAIGSNFDDRLKQVVRQLKPLRDINRVFYSAEIGWMKPASQFYQTIAKRLELAPQEILMIGDTLETDIEGAKRAGWQALWLNRQPSQTSASNPQGWHADMDTLQSLTDLPAWLIKHS